MSLVTRQVPCHLFLGDPTTASGADMVYLGKTRGDVVFTPNVNIATGFADQTGLTPLAVSVVDSGATPMLQAPLIDEDLDKMIQYITGGTIVENSGKKALGFSAGVQKIAVANIYTLAAIPIDEIAEGTNGIDAPNAIWIPRVIAKNLGDFTHKLAEGDDSFNPHTVEFHALYHETDHNDDVVNEALRRGFIGTPNADTGLTWSLPAVSE